MRYRLYFIRQHSWGIELASAPRSYYTNELLDLDTIFSSGGKTSSFILTLNHSPEKDPKFKNLFPVDGYNHTYIVNLGEDTFEFLLVGESSKLFNYNLIDRSSEIMNSSSISRYNIHKLITIYKEIGLDIANGIKRRFYSR